MHDILVHFPTLLFLCLIPLAAALPFLKAFPAQPAPPTSGLLAGLGLALAIAAFLAVVLSGWAVGRSQTNLLGGLIPWSDATGYFRGAHSMLDNGELLSWSQRRPLYTLLLAGFFALGERDVQIALLLQAALVGAVAFLVARAVSFRMGMAAGLFVFALLFAYAREYAPILLSENAGFLFGALGIALLWLGAEKPRCSWLLAGSLLLSLGLMARAGAFLIIPFLLLWAWLAFRQERRVALRAPLAVLGGVVAAALLHQAIYWLSGDATNPPLSNFSYVLYGLAAGGKGWKQIYLDHPDIFQGGEGAFSQIIYALAFERIATNPFDFIFAYVKKLPHSVYFLFDYTLSFLHIKRLFALLWLAGLLVAFRRRREPQALLLVVTVPGIVLSGPFLADVGSRIYAATVAFDAYLAGLGFTAMVGWLSRKRSQIVPASASPLAAQLAVTAGILVALTLSSLYPLLRSKDRVPATFACTGEKIPAAFRLGSESPVLALRTSPPFTLFPPQAPHAGFASQFNSRIYLPETLKLASPDTAFITAYVREPEGKSTTLQIAWKTETLPPRGSWVGFCLKEDFHPVLGRPFRVPARVEMLKTD
ncbi:MAG: hypothetical protein J4G10_05755 [Alphaproteobacteria bacterium]|nr:hypothetical protein [Alphaproteobacteria bacterium]